MWAAVMCTCWMIQVVEEGARNSRSQRSAMAPPAAPVKPKVTSPPARAASSARSTFARIAGGRDAEKDVARPAEPLDLPLEDAIEPVIIAGGGQGGAVRGERDRREGRVVEEQAGDEFAGDVLRVRRTAAIAREHQLVAGAHGRRGGLGHDGEQLVQPLVARKGRVRRLGLGEIGGHEFPIHAG